MYENIQIGTCGFRHSKYEYAEKLRAVEIQHTFYNPPLVPTLERWREEMPAAFEFTLKAWQLITHESSSPTYKRLRRKLTEKESAESGFFKATDIVKEAYDRTIESAAALKAKTVLFQCPAKFTPVPANIRNMKKFFNKVDRKGLNFAWELRGDWDPKMIAKLCDDLDLWHAVDPFKTATQTPQRCYYRLHGRYDGVIRMKTANSKNSFPSSR